MSMAKKAVPTPAKDTEEFQTAMQNLIAQGRKDGVIRDLREPTKEDFGWIMTSL